MSFELKCVSLPTEMEKFSDMKNVFEKNNKNENEKLFPFS